MAGIMPTTLATSAGNQHWSPVTTEKQSNSLCFLPELSDDCSTEFNNFASEKFSLPISLWQSKTTPRILFNRITDGCNISSFRFNNLEQPRRVPNYSLSRQGYFSSGTSGQIALPLAQLARTPCAFPWQKRLTQKHLNFHLLQGNNVLAQHSTGADEPKQFQFPQLSRSSLIVAFPHENSNFVPQNTKLANPAPRTKRIASSFGWRKRPYSNQLQFHQGIDYGAPLGSPVVAVGSGIVTKVVSGCNDFGNLFCGGQLGNWIEVDHGQGRVGIYGHLKQGSIKVRPGMKVWKNQNIAQVGSSGWSTGAHLDFRLKINGKHQDPAKHVMAIQKKRQIK